MVTYAPAPSTFNPAAPQNLAELGISESLVLDLVLRRLMIEGYSTLAGLSRSLRIAVPIVDVAFKHMRQQMLIDVKGMTGNDYNFTLWRRASNWPVNASRFRSTRAPARFRSMNTTRR